MNLLLSHGAQPDCRDNTGVTPLFSAASTTDDSKCIEILLDCGADINSKDCDQIFPLLSAAQNGNPENTEILLNRGADMELTEAEGWTSLAATVFFNEVESIQVLLDHGASLLPVTNDGENVLHIIAKYAKLPTLQIFAEASLHGLDPAATTDAGETAQNIANSRVDVDSQWREQFQQIIEHTGMPTESLTPEKIRLLSSCTVAKEDDWSCPPDEPSREFGLDSDSNEELESLDSDIFEDALEVQVRE